MSHSIIPTPLPLLPSEYFHQLANQLAERILDQLAAIDAPPALTHLVHALSFFSSDGAGKVSAEDLQFFLALGTEGLTKTGGLQ